MNQRLEDDDLNGVWHLAHTEPEEPWPASVVEALAAEVIVARGGDLSAVLEAGLGLPGSGPLPSVPMVRSIRGYHSQRIIIDEPEFDPREVEEELRIDGGP